MTMPYDPLDEERTLVAELRHDIGTRLSEYARALTNAGRPPETSAERHETVRRLIADALDDLAKSRLGNGAQALDHAVEARIARAVTDSLLGLGALQELLDDPRIENININGADNVFVRYADGSKERSRPVVASDEDLADLVRTIAARAGVEERRFDRAVPRLNIQLPDGSRMFAVTAVTGRVTVSIRRHRFPRITLDELRHYEVFDESVQALLAALVRARKNILVAGGVNVGKTTLLRGLASEIPSSERLVTIEDTFELGLDHDSEAHPDVVPMQAREANIEGFGAIDQAELVRWALRMAPDRVIVGEIRGAEVVPMCNAMSQGNDGSLSTIHASTSRGVFAKLAAYAAQSPERLSLEATNLLVAAAVDFVVHLGWDADGVRVVDSVREVVDADGLHVVTNEVFRPGEDGRATPGVPPRAETMDALVAAGLDADEFIAPWRGRWQ